MPEKIPNFDEFIKTQKTEAIPTFDEFNSKNDDGPKAGFLQRGYEATIGSVLDTGKSLVNKYQENAKSIAPDPLSPSKVPVMAAAGAVRDTFIKPVVDRFNANPDKMPTYSPMRAVDAVIGPMAEKVKNDWDKGDYGGVAGTIGGTALMGGLGPKAIKAVPGAVKSVASTALDVAEMAPHATNIAKGVIKGGYDAARAPGQIPMYLMAGSAAEGAARLMGAPPYAGATLGLFAKGLPGAIKGGRQALADARAADAVKASRATSRVPAWMETATVEQLPQKGAITGADAVAEAITAKKADLANRAVKPTPPVRKSTWEGKTTGDTPIAPEPINPANPNEIAAAIEARKAVRASNWKDPKPSEAKPTAKADPVKEVIPQIEGVTPQKWAKMSDTDKQHVRNIEAALKRDIEKKASVSDLPEQLPQKRTVDEISRDLANEAGLSTTEDLLKNKKGLSAKAQYEKDLAIDGNRKNLVDIKEKNLRASGWNEDAIKKHGVEKFKENAKGLMEGRSTDSWKALMERFGIIE